MITLSLADDEAELVRDAMSMAAARAIHELDWLERDAAESGSVKLIDYCKAQREKSERLQSIADRLERK